MSITKLFELLRSSPSSHTYTAARIKGYDNVYLGVNLVGQPCLLVSAENGAANPPLRTAKVSFRPGQELSVAMDDNAASIQIFHMLSCESSGRVDIENFLILIEAFLAHNIGQTVDGDILASFFRSMIKLFSLEHARDLNAERQGLWGELFVMRYIRGFKFWAQFWHSEITRIFDFSTTGKRVEVKTTTSGQRVHHFSHRQIYATEEEEIVIASLLLRIEDSGLSLRQLINDCRQALIDSPYILKAERAIRHAGMEDSSESGPVFDAIEAQTRLSWFKSTEVPHFRIPEPPGVSETKYKADLTTATCLNQEEINVWLDTWPVASDAPVQAFGH